MEDYFRKLNGVQFPDEQFFVRADKTSLVLHVWPLMMQLPPEQF